MVERGGGGGGPALDEPFERMDGWVSGEAGEAPRGWPSGRRLPGDRVGAACAARRAGGLQWNKELVAHPAVVAVSPKTQAPILIRNGPARDKKQMEGLTGLLSPESLRGRGIRLVEGYVDKL